MGVGDAFADFLFWRSMELSCLMILCAFNQLGFFGFHEWAIKSIANPCQSKSFSTYSISFITDKTDELRMYVCGLIFLEKFRGQAGEERA